MIYRTFDNLKLSQLGMGAMRLPVLDGKDANIDVAQTEKMVAHAIASGVNYFDTAWGYHGGQSEVVMGNALKKYPRDTWFLASKFPGYDLSNMGKVEEIFEKQLEKCGVDHFDFYLFHNVCEMNIDAYLNPQYGILGYLLAQKKNGRIRHLGFSVHGSLEVMRRFLDAYGAHMEFGQIQLNYLDYLLQEAKEKAELLAERHIPIWVMEPLRGGRLSRLSEGEWASLKGLRANETMTALAFRFLQSIPGVMVILSGMSDFEQMQQNIQTFATDAPLSPNEMETVLKVAADMLKKKTLPCTACNYCIDHCPQELNIPGLLALYNEHRFTEGGFIAPMALMAMEKEKRPGACIGCGECSAVCPQQIAIPEAMTEFAAMLPF